jgi:hypothetical protein
MQHRSLRPSRLSTRDSLAHERRRDALPARFGPHRHAVDGNLSRDVLEVHQGLADRLPVEVGHEPHAWVPISDPIAVERLDQVALLLRH